MKRLYVLPYRVWKQASAKCLFHPISDGHFGIIEGIPDGIDARGVREYLEANPEVLVLASAMCNGEAAEEEFGQHPDVAALPDPVFEGTIKLAAHRDNPKTRFVHHHHEALKKIGVTDTDTVMDVSRKAATFWPMVKVKHIL